MVLLEDRNSKIGVTEKWIRCKFYNQINDRTILMMPGIDFFQYLGAYIYTKFDSSSDLCIRSNSGCTSILVDSLHNIAYKVISWEEALSLC